jgi:dihydroorotate dehydrogenase (NAD+) catalytic subunit
MLNGIGIQNPGIDAWGDETGPRLRTLPVPVWGSAVGGDPDEFARVATRLEELGVAAIEINLSCPNLEDGRMFALDADRSARVVDEVRSAVDLPIGAKLSPNAERIAVVAGACATAGADWVVLTNTVWGASIDLETRRPALSGTIGGYSGPPIKPVAMRCVIEVRQAHPQLPILGCGGVTSGADVVEYLLAGASAVGVGTIHFAEPRAGRRILGELQRWCRAHSVGRVSDLVGGMVPW